MAGSYCTDKHSYALVVNCVRAYCNRTRVRRTRKAIAFNTPQLASLVAFNAPISCTNHVTTVFSTCTNV